MNIKEKLSGAKEKISKLQWKRIIATRAFVSVGCIMLICMAVLVGTLVDRGESIATGAEGDRLLGNALLVDAQMYEEQVNAEAENEANANPETAEDFFAMAIINRTQVRDSALEVLREIASSPDTHPDAKEDALSSIADIVDDMSAEANIETLLRAKGISQCVAVISGENCSVIVNTENGLAPDQLVQITDIVFEQAGIPVENITVVEA